MSDTPKTSRRSLLQGALALAVVGGGWQAWVHRPRAMTFDPIPNLPGWRQTVFEGLSAPRGGLSSAAVLAGIDSDPTAGETLEPSALCRTLFRSPHPTKVPVAVFSDFFCPFCRVLVERLSARLDKGNVPFDVTWHELPLLGPSSEIAARAGIAADLQGGYPAFQANLLGSPFRPTTQHLYRVATSSRLDPSRLVVDMEEGVVKSRLARSRTAARTLGIYGTPAMVVGRTLVIGEISERNFDKLIELETGVAGTC